MLLRLSVLFFNLLDVCPWAAWCQNDLQREDFASSSRQFSSQVLELFTTPCLFVCSFFCGLFFLCYNHIYRKQRFTTALTLFFKRIIELPVNGEMGNDILVIYSMALFIALCFV